MSRVRIILYATSSCPKCHVLKEWLKERGIEFMEKDLSDPDVMADLIMRDVFVSSAPLLEVDGKFYSENELFADSSLNEDLLLSLLEEIIYG